MVTMMIAGVLAVALVQPPPAQVTLAARRTITLDAARKVAGAAETEARKNQWAVAIAVVDDAGHLILFHRMDDAKLIAIDIAVRKARTAVYFREPTKNLETEVAGGRTALLPIDGFMPLEGGVPLVVDGKVVGAVGVSGMTGAQDAQCAAAGAGTLK
jgi:glc operon protein GlcG